MSAFDYLLKPIDEEELISSIQKYAKKINHSNWNQKLELLYQNLQEQKAYSKRISLSTKEGIHLVDVAQIIHLEAYKNYTSVFSEQLGTIVVSKTIKELEKLLDPEAFVRVHQSHIVNWQKVSSYQRGSAGSLILSNGTRIPVSKQKKNMVLEKLFP